MFTYPPGSFRKVEKKKTPFFLHNLCKMFYKACPTYAILSRNDYILSPFQRSDYFHQMIYRNHLVCLNGRHRVLSLLMIPDFYPLFQFFNPLFPTIFSIATSHESFSSLKSLVNLIFEIKVSNCTFKSFKCIAWDASMN